MNTHAVPFTEHDQPTVAPMDISNRLLEIRSLIHAGQLTPEQAHVYATWAASQFWAHQPSDESYPSDAVIILCEIAAHPEPAVAQPGQESLFSLLIERLSDSFNPEYCRLYDRMFAEVVDWCRHQPAGRRLDEELARFGLYTAQDLLARKDRLAHPALRFFLHPKQIKKVVILSRVTLGADVAVTATLIAKMKRRFPQARCVIVGPPTLQEIFAEDTRVRVRPLHYAREGSLIERLNAWLEVPQIMREEMADCLLEECLVIDPDSRLTQLGIFPVVADDSRYLFFQSRSYGSHCLDSIGQLTNRWANETLGGDETVYPEITLSTPDRDYAGALRERLNQIVGRRVIAINFGVGGNNAKRLSETFEQKLVRQLIENGNFVLLAKGLGREEVERSARLLERLAADGKTCIEINTYAGRTLPDSADLKCDCLAWEGPLGVYAALLSVSDVYIGYDSGGQHISAALGIPTIDIFAYVPFPLFIHRWRPYGPGAVHVIDASHRQPEDPQAERTIRDQILGLLAPRG